ncbi:MAG: hypothetical protein O3A46_16585, partial [Candidatus Poribacteria bacterium]|nr:hypothetical protein [Candidatus Poribacteria bacterium]
MAQRWKTSKWLRLHDWDWERDPCIPSQEPWMAQRRSFLSNKFYYHVLRAAEMNQTSIGDQSGEATFVQYNTIVHALLEAAG